MTDYIDRQLGNYRLLRLLGHGGFADVYLGEHIHLKTLAAIKMLHTQLTNDDVEKFRTEARTIASLDHPNIVRVLDFGIEHLTPFLVMHYAPYGTLRQHHPRGVRLPLSTIVSYVKQVADALYYAHQRKLIHRDVKPENMLLGRNNEVLLSDFGFVVIAQSSWSESTEMAGTIPYMAPEQLQGKPRPASDLYALAVVVYEWMCGERPFNGTPMEIATQHMLSAPPSLCARSSTIPSSVEEVVMIALAKDPQQRFSSVKAFAYALEQACLDAPSSGTTLPLVEPAQLPFAPLPIAPVTPVLSPLEQAETPQLSDTPSSSPAEPTVADTHRPPAPDAAPPARSRQPGSQSRRSFVTGLLGGAALTSAAGGGFWLAQTKGWLERKTPPPSPSPTHVLPLPGTTLYTYQGHSDRVYAVAWSPDGYRIASASRDDTAQVWDAATGERVITYKGHVYWVLTVAWSPDGKHLVSGGASADAPGPVDNTAQVWDASTGKHLYTLPANLDAVSAIAWSPDGKRIASGSYDRTVQVWDAFTGANKLIYRDHIAGVTTLAWSPDGTSIASAGFDNTVRVWNARTGQTTHVYRGHTNQVLSIAWSPDGNFIASASGDNGSRGAKEHTVRVWNVLDDITTFIYREHTDEVRGVTWSPDGKRIASSSGPNEHQVHVWDAFTGGNKLVYRGHTGDVHSVAWAPEGKRIASASEDHTVQVWWAV